MLLNNESHYYTIFMYEDYSYPYSKMADWILDIVKDLGDVKAIERNGTVMEFWVMYDGECRMFVLFDYEKGVVRV